MNVKILRNVDRYLFGALILLLFLLKYLYASQKNKIRSHPKRILVIRLWALGSSLLTFPMIKQLKDHYRDRVQYDLLASSRNIGIFKNQGYFKYCYNIFRLKDILKLICKFKYYDIVIDAEEYFKISTLRSLWLGKINIGYVNIWNRKIAYVYPVWYQEMTHNLMNCIGLLHSLGIKTYKPETMEPLVYKEKDKGKVDHFLSTVLRLSLSIKLICMHTGGAETAKDRAWPQKKWIELIKALIEKYPNIKILLSGTDSEKEIVQNIIIHLPETYKKSVINVCGMFNLFEFAYLLQKCNLMVSNDTGPMHLAAAMGTKTIGLFGPELSRKFSPYPLGKNIGLYKGDGNACIKVHLAIWERDENYQVDKITVSDVLSNIHNLS